MSSGRDSPFIAINFTNAGFYFVEDGCREDECLRRFEGHLEIDRQLLGLLGARDKLHRNHIAFDFVFEGRNGSFRGFYSEKSCFGCIDPSHEVAFIGHHFKTTNLIDMGRLPEVKVYLRTVFIEWLKISGLAFPHFGAIPSLTGLVSAAIFLIAQADEGTVPDIDHA